MTTKRKRVCWDSCIFIDKLQERTGRVAFIDPLLWEAEKGRLTIVASTLAIVETINVKQVQPLEEVCLIEEFFRRTYISLRPLDRAIALRAQKIRQAHKKVSPADAGHLATALATDTPYFLTTDGINPKNEGALLALDRKLDGLRILTPEQYLAKEFAHLEGCYGLMSDRK